MIFKYPSLYKTDTKGNLRIWYVERQDSEYRMWDGLLDGKIKASIWRAAEATNVGKANERNAFQQAEFEIDALYKKKLEVDYHTSTASALDGGAHIFEPMLAEKYKKFSPGYVQPKLDGFRCIVNRDGMWSRTGKPFVSSPHILEQLAAVFETHPDLILDGELYNHELRDNFDEIQSLITVKGDKSLTDEHYAKTREMVQYHVYDVPSHPGTFVERWLFLQKIVGDTGLPSIISVDTQRVFEEAHADDAHALFIGQGFEGSIWRADTKYENKRTKNLLKRKEFVDEEFEVVEIQEGKGNWSGVAKSVLCRLPDGRTFGAGIKGSRERAASLLLEGHKVVTVTYFQRTPDGIPRFPIATKFHGEKREF